MNIRAFYILKGMVSNLIISVAIPAKQKELQQTYCKLWNLKLWNNKSYSYETACTICKEPFSPVYNMRFRTIFSSACYVIQSHSLVWPYLFFWGEGSICQWILGFFQKISESRPFVEVDWWWWSLGARTLSAKIVDRETLGRKEINISKRYE